MDKPQNLEGKVAIVTGGSEGIGFGIASSLASSGASVYLIARTQEKLEKAKKEIEDGGGKAEFFSADITNAPQIKRIIDEIYKREKRLDFFVNNAGSWVGQNINTNFSDIWKLIEFDMKAPYEITHYLIKKFKDKKGDDLRILTVSSQAALKVFDSGLGYGPAKMGLTAALFHLQKELEIEKISNIKLYRLYPDTVATEKMLPAIREGKVQNPVRINEVIQTAMDLLLERTPTRDARIGYYPGMGIVRTDIPSVPEEFYSRKKTKEIIINPNFTPEDLFK